MFPFEATECFADLGQAKFADGGSISGSSLLSLLSKLPLK